MKEKRILDALTQVDDRFIEDAARAGKTRARLRWGGLAACLVLLAGVGAGTYLRPAAPAVSPTPRGGGPTGGLPILTLEFDAGGMGFEGFILDPGQLEASRDTACASLPVYRNLAALGELPVPHYLDAEQLLDRAEETAAALGTTLEHWQYDSASRTSSPPVEGEEGVVYRLSAETGLGEIEVDGTGQVSVFFDPALDLPDTYSFTYSDTTGEQAGQTFAYLLERFSSLCALETPLPRTGGDYNIYGQFHRTYTVYDGALSDPQQALGRQVSFSPNEEGQLWILRVSRVLDAAEQVGVYPLISAGQARALLLEGRYLTTVPGEYLSGGAVTEEAIAYFELTYRTSRYEQTFLPYYRFYVELDSTAFRPLPGGLKQYGVYYVPAVEGAYLSALPENGQLPFQ